MVNFFFCVFTTNEIVDWPWLFIHLRIVKMYLHTNIFFSVLTILINCICLLYFRSYANVKYMFGKVVDLQSGWVSMWRLSSPMEYSLLNLVKILQFIITKIYLLCLFLWNKFQLMFKPTYCKMYILLYWTWKMEKRLFYGAQN